MALIARHWNVPAGAVVCASTLRAMTDELTEIERARENLIQSGKPFGGPSRRDSMPMMGGPRPYSDYGKCYIIILPVEAKLTAALQTLA